MNNEYLTLDEYNTTIKEEKDQNIFTLEKVKERLQDETQKNVMEKIINSAKNDNTEVPKVINLVEIPETTEELKNKDENSTEVKPTDVDTIESKSRFIRKKINFNALDELYLEEATKFVQRYRETHSTEEEIPKRLSESYVEEILSIPVTNEDKTNVVCAVPFLDIPSLGIPEDKVLAALSEEINEDILFSFITMYPYDSEKGDFVYSEDSIDVVSSEYPISI